MRSEAQMRAARIEDMAACAGSDWMPRVHPAEDDVRHDREHVFTACRMTVGEAGGAVQGFLALGADGRVDALYLAAEARGRGLGAALIEAAKAERPAGLELGTFVANEGSRRFYARHGFRESRRTEGDNEERLPDVLLGWPGAAA